MGKDYLGQTFIKQSLTILFHVFFHRHIILYAPQSTLKSKQNQAPKYKQNVDELIRPHPRCLVLPLLPDESDVHV